MKKRILIVEDEVMTSIIEREMLEKLGHEVTGIALSGEVAIQLAGAHKPDLILMDIKLMGVIDGTEAASKIRELYKTPVVFVTAFGEKKTVEVGRRNVPEGFGYIVKPYTIEELESEINRLIG